MDGRCYGRVMVGACWAPEKSARRTMNQLFYNIDIIWSNFSFFKLIERSLICILMGSLHHQCGSIIFWSTLMTLLNCLAEISWLCWQRLRYNEYFTLVHLQRIEHSLLMWILRSIPISRTRKRNQTRGRKDQLCMTRALTSQIPWTLVFHRQSTGQRGDKSK